MKSICLYLHIHQPLRFREYSAFDISNKSDYFRGTGRTDNRRIFIKVARNSYYPMFSILSNLLAGCPRFKISLSITGTWLVQAQKWAPDLITMLQKMVKTGRVEILGETFYHSLSFFYDEAEFSAQVKKHSDLIFKIFGVRPTSFRNTELAYNDQLAHWADTYGYKVILAEGWDDILKGRPTGHVYAPKNCKNLRLLLKNYQLSDDIAFRFSDRKWPEYPLTVSKYLAALEKATSSAPLVNLFMDFETFGEHQWASTGIFDFFTDFVHTWSTKRAHKFVTVSEAARLETPIDTISVPHALTWADSERDLSAWRGNSLQDSAMDTLYNLKSQIFETKDPSLISDWRLLTTSDHAYSMCTKYWHDGNVHAYFSAYASPYESFMYFMNILRDLEYRISTHKK